MTHTYKFLKTGTSATVALLLALSMAACNNNTPADVPQSSNSDSGSSGNSSRPHHRSGEIAMAEQPAVCNSCGTITNIEEIKAKGTGSGIGAITGAVIGGVVGHQFGGGKGNDVATVAGAGAGAYAGHQAERQYNSSTSYRVTISMESGGTRTVNMPALNGVSVGSKVKVSGDSLSLI